MYQKIKERELTIGHLKYLIDDSEQFYKISYTTTSIQKQDLLFNSTSLNASVIINARVQTTPKILEQIFYAAVDEAALQTNSNIQIQSLSAFKPGFPKPTYRKAN
jgi:hypothetical protein